MVQMLYIHFFCLATVDKALARVAEVAEKITPAVVLFLMEIFCSGIWDERWHDVPVPGKVELSSTFPGFTAGLIRF